MVDLTRDMLDDLLCGLRLAHEIVVSTVEDKRIEFQQLENYMDYVTSFVRSTELEGFSVSGAFNELADDSEKYISIHE